MARKPKDLYSDHKWVLEQLMAAQEADTDNREAAREAELFLHKRDGQWEPDVYLAADDAPRYTFDLVTSVVAQISGAVCRNDFDIRVRPAGGQSSRETAGVYDGLIRNIENISKSRTNLKRATRRMVESGFDAVRVIQAYADPDSFDEDLLIERIPNAIDRVWWGPHQEADASDAPYAFILTPMTKEEYEATFPEGPTNAGVPSDRQSDSWWHRYAGLVMIAEFLYFIEKPSELVQMSNGKVYRAGLELESALPGLAASGITEVRRRATVEKCVYSRLLTTEGWIGKPRKTKFRNTLPLIPLYANFDVYEDKIIYHGAVERLMDPQRVLNYAASREVAEVALSPREKYWMTPTQAAGHEATLATLNTSQSPVQLYNNDPSIPGAPQKQAGGQANPGLQSVRSAMSDIIGQISGMFAANMGDNPGLQSGVAIDLLQDRGDVGSDPYSLARETMMEQIGRILVDTIPRVYNPGRQVRLMGEDGTSELVTLGEVTVDMATGMPIVLNDLNQGRYDVTCVVGPSFRSRQSETVRTMTELGKIDQTIIEMGGDILLNNVAAPGMDDLAARKRAQLVASGVVPPEQLTEEEQQALQAAQEQGQGQPDPAMIMAMAEQAKAEAEAAGVQQRAQASQSELQLKMMELQIKNQQAQVEAQLKEQELQLKLAEARNHALELQIKLAQAQATIQKDSASTQKTLAEAEAQQIENDLALSGVADLLNAVGSLQ